MQVLYIIPARGGSKGLPNKNIRLLENKPMIAYSIIAAQKSNYKGTIVVSTDSKKIATIAKEYGAEVPFMRPPELASDTATSMDVIFHAINYYKERNIHFDVVVLLQPTSPLRISEDINNAMKKFINENAEAIVGVCEAEHHPLWSNTLPENGSMKNFLSESIKGLNRQQLPIYYRLNGAIFISKTDTLYKEKTFIHENTFSYIMPNERSIDIDYEIDFRLAELLMKKH
jgi:CMP-N,N'-diacetyllegionaminic acid synthase